MVCCHPHNLQSLFHSLERIGHSKGPKIDPSSTPKSISSEELYVESILVL